MATFDITVPAGSGVGNSDTAAAAFTEPGDFDGATIDDVSVVGTPTITSDGATDDTIGIRWRIQTDGDAAIWGDYGSDAVSACSAVLGDSVSSDTITDGSAPSPAPTTAVAADWDEIAYLANYNASGMPDAETCSWSAFTIRVTYTPAAPEDNLLADDVQSTSEVTTPAIGQEHVLLANDVESASEVGAPAVGQEHALLADDVESASELSTPTASESHILLADDVESASEVTTPSIAQIHVLDATDVESASELTAPVLGQEHVLLADDVQSLSEVGNPVLAEVGVGSVGAYIIPARRRGRR